MMTMRWDAGEADSMKRWQTECRRVCDREKELLGGACSGNAIQCYGSTVKSHVTDV